MTGVKLLAMRPYIIKLVSYHKRRIPPAQIIQVSELLKNSKVLGEDSLETQVFKGNSQEFEK